MLFFVNVSASNDLQIMLVFYYIDIWLEYVKLERSHPHGDPANSSKLHWRAKKALSDTLVDDFIGKYTLLQTGHDIVQDTQ